MARRRTSRVRPGVLPHGPADRTIDDLEPWARPHRPPSRRSDLSGRDARPCPEPGSSSPWHKSPNPSSAETIAQFERYVIPNYRRYPVCLVRGEGSLDLGRRGAPLSRLLPRLGLQPARPLPAAGRRGGPRAGRPVDPRAEYLVHGGPGGVRPGPLRAVVRRPVLLLQQRGRGQRGGHQARPAPRPRRGPVQDRHRWRAGSTAGPTPP